MNGEPTQPDTESVARDWRARGFSCDVWSDSAGQVWADFVHASDELVMLIDGVVELRFGGQVLHPAPGEEVLIPAGTVHTVINNGSGTNRWLYGYRRR
jgi:quercetin dioxygenase-like cupin family protein